MLKVSTFSTTSASAVNYMGAWNASTNDPALASGIGATGAYYVVSVAGDTDLDGITSWGVGDWAVFGTTTWQRLEGGTQLNAKTLLVEETSQFEGNITANALTALQAVATDASKRLISVPNTGSGDNVLATTPTLVAPIIGAASATSVNKVAITAPATGATLTIADGKTLTVNSSVTLAGTDGTTMTFPTTSATLARTDASNTFTGHQTIEGVTSTGATGTGKLVFDTSPTIAGHPTIEGVTSTGATGTGKLVFDTSPTIAGHPTIEGVTSTGVTGLGKLVFDASPALTGTPTAPTATTGDNTTKIATTAFVTTAVANVEITTISGGTYE
jgi:hypothetical protein